MISFHLQAPSTAWEPVALRLGSSPVVWAWFKPSHAPSSVVFQIPPEVWQEVNSATPVTIRQLVAIAGIPALQGWTVAGQYYAWDERLAVFVDLPLAEPPAGVDPYLILWCQMTATLQTSIRIESPPPMLASDPPLNEDSGALFDSMDSLWRGIQQIETDVRRARSQLEQSMHRLNSLNRDLGPNEINAADSNDKKDWIDARRWLRDSAGILSKSSKSMSVYSAEPGSDTDSKIFFSNTSRLAVFFQESSRRLSISRCTTKPRNMSCCRLNRLWPKGAPMVSDAQTTSCSELPERFANAGLTDEAPSRV